MSKKKQPHTPDTPPTSPTPNVVYAQPLWERPWVVSGLLLAVAALAYGGSIGNDFVFFDDDKAILYNKSLQNPTFSGFFQGQNLGMFAPFTWMAYWLGQSISGQAAWGYHLIAVVLHALNAVLAFNLLQGLTQRYWAALGAALVFAAHPIQAEAVCWAAGMSAVLFSTFYLAAAWAWVNWSERKQPLHYGLALFAFLAACLSKSAAVTLPLVLVLLDWYRGQSMFSSRFWLSKLPFFALSLYFGLHTFSTRAQEGHDMEYASNAFSLADRFFMICQTTLFYPFKILLPVGYSVAYPFVKEGGQWGISYLVAPLVLVVLGFLTWKYLRQRREYLLGIGLYLLPLLVMLPFRTVGNFELRSDRYAYLSILGIGWLIFLLLEKLDKKALVATTATVGVALALLSMQQAKVWQNGTALFTNCVSKTPESSLCQCNLAYSSLLERNFDSAIRHYSEALKYDTTTIEAYNGRGQAYMEQRRFGEAYSDFDNAIKKGLSSPKLFLNRAKCAVINGMPEKAIPDLNKSLELEPKSPEAYYFRAVANDKINQSEQAIKDYAAALQLNPNYVEAWVNRGQLQFKAQQYAAAIEDFSKALAIAAPSVQPMILVNRANAYMMSGDRAQAAQDIDKALSINPNFERAKQAKAAM